MSSTGITDPPPTWCVFSSVSRSMTATLYPSGSSAAATASAVSMPREGARISMAATPDSTALDVASTREMCDVASVATKCPERTYVCTAIWFAIVPEAT